MIFRFCILCFCLSLCGKAEAQQKKGLRVGLVQASFLWGDVEGNLKAFGRKMAECKEGDLIVLPELFASGCLMKKREKQESFREKVRVASYFTRVTDSLKQWSARTGAVIMGSTVYNENGKFYNRLVVAFPDGECRFYDKHNCFKMSGYTPGEEQLVFEYKGYKIATYICYDLRFPEWSKNRVGYDMAVYVANWPESRQKDWETLLRERAIENKAYIAGVNCCGTDPGGLKYAGGSRLLNPEGKVLGECRDFTDEIVWVDVDTRF
ncbi:nitrilase-related carbon-nitrogen hydrolase [uncultured Sanguibacteroides sp.]|uniref:nitrilase-related carbon-nitrogen hydrolase n=1 Tax=uncultured Sanguibacteroides sp. TaxID=1635151 RepID=UPI0025EF9675|nr:nitrilase-related carbon-nitrogen hydrolase [uncultured Sanguibacteroides sp.]